MSTASPPAKSNAVNLRFTPYGGNYDLFEHTDPEVLLSGPAGTGKSRACLEKLHLAALKHPGMRGLMARKTRASLTESAMMTFERKVLHDLDGVSLHTSTQEYRYPNGSLIVVAGLDKASKIMSSEYDVAYIQEATELTEHDWETITTRLRNGAMPYQQIVGDCNPNAPTHWLKKRTEAGRTLVLETRHEDNPVLWDRLGGTWTPQGAVYMSKLDNLTGVRYLRLRKGIWAAAEGMVYDNWDRSIHLVDHFNPPKEWRRIRAIDFGYTNPFVCQWWAIDGDGRMYLYREIYRAQQTVKVHSARIKHYSEGEKCERTVADHDAEDRATLVENGISSEAAKKDITVGVQKVQERLKKAGDGKPRLFIMRDALVERDGDLAEVGRPTCTADEIESYCWPKGIDGKPVKEDPLAVDNHGMDAMRYAVMYIDGPKATLQVIAKNPLFWSG